MRVIFLQEKRTTREFLSFSLYITRDGWLQHLMFVGRELKKKNNYTIHFDFCERIKETIFFLP